MNTNHELSALGFSITHEGGGVMVYTLPLSHGLRLVVVGRDGALPEDDGPCSVVLMSEAHGDPIMQSEHATGVDAVRHLVGSVLPS